MQKVQLVKDNTYFKISKNSKVRYIVELKDKKNKVVLATSEQSGRTYKIAYNTLIHI